MKKFFLTPLTASDAEMTVGSAGQGCSLTLLNPDLQIFVNAALVTAQPTHGQAAAQVITGGTQAMVSYTPQPGYVGPDSFSVTLEPNNTAIRFAVTVQSIAPAS